MDPNNKLPTRYAPWYVSIIFHKSLDNGLSGRESTLQARIIHCCRESNDVWTNEAPQPRKPGEKFDEGRGESTVAHMGEKERP